MPSQRKCARTRTDNELLCWVRARTNGDDCPKYFNGPLESHFGVVCEHQAQVASFRAIVFGTRVWERLLVWNVGVGGRRVLC